MSRYVHFHFITIVILSLILFQLFGGNDGKHLNSVDNIEDWMHTHKPSTKYRTLGKPRYESSHHWMKSAQASLLEKLGYENIVGVAKNTILFLGDGMSLPTVTAARIFKGQLEGSDFGEEASLNFEKFPHVGISKTFCSDSQVADSACSATAYLSGTKANIATIGVKPSVGFRDCKNMMNASHQVESVLAWAQAAGKSTGIITTTRVTHASPAGTYAHIADRDWESDGAIKNSGADPLFCDDVAEQLILRNPGQKINVILGGGRRELTPTTVIDPENKVGGKRRDGKNLIETWKELKTGQNAEYVWNKDQFEKVNTSQTDFLLGLFSYDHLDYVMDADETKDPSLPEMTRKAIEILSRNPKGYFLFIEGGRIDHAHHSTKAQKALIETIAMDSAVQTCVEMTNVSDTLIVVTADHAHVMTMAGYPQRGNPILGFAGISDVDDLPYTTLSYANGPGYKHPEDNGDRFDMTNDNLEHPEYAQMSGVPLLSETHGGDDVLIYSRGPYSHLLTGVVDQSFIPHAIGFASCTGPGLKHCNSASAKNANINPVSSLHSNININTDPSPILVPSPDITAPQKQPVTLSGTGIIKVHRRRKKTHAPEGTTKPTII